MATKMTLDGNTAVSHVAYAFSDVAAIFPITPSSPMAEMVDEWAAGGRKNLFGQTVRVSEMQSEAGAAGAVHGALLGGAMTTTYTASQGLLLMIPNMYKISGEVMPCVFHVSARALATHALSIFGDHSDVMSCRQTGFAMLASGSVQEAMDMALIAHLATIDSSVPFLHFFDGFRTSHEMQKIDGIDYDEIRTLVNFDKIEAFRSRALNPEKPHLQGTAQNPDVYFQNREAANNYYAATPAIVDAVMRKVGKLTGRAYKLFDYVGAPDADRVVMAMGSGCEALEETVNLLVSQGEKVGLIKVRLYRPFAVDQFLQAIPKTCKTLSVLDRTKEPGALGEPLYTDVQAALRESGNTTIKVVGGRYGLGSKEFNPTMAKAVFDNSKQAEPKNHFTVGIEDDVSHTSLPIGEVINAAPAGTVCYKFYGLGSDGTVGANKNSIKIVGDHTDLYVQGYFSYDSKKSGGITVSHLRFAQKPIQSTYLIDMADFVACHNPSYVTRYDMLTTLKPGGVFLLNSQWSVADMEKELPAEMKRQLATKKIRFYNVNAVKLAEETGMGHRINTVMQAAFFKLTEVIPYANADRYMKEAVAKTYGRKGEAVVQMNNASIDAGAKHIEEIPVPAEWVSATTGALPAKISATEYFDSTVLPVLRQEGDTLPVSAFSPAGVIPTSTSQYEKRGIAVHIPCWDSENCIQCNQCAFVCPHATIRPVLLSQAQQAGAPRTFGTIPAIGKEYTGCGYRIQVSPLDCSGCGNCAQVCPGKKQQKALVMKPLASQLKEQNANWEYAAKLPDFALPTNRETVKGSQFLRPLFEFSGACAGCGETPYIKLLSQLFGDRMMIANATGCSSIYGGTFPTSPYCANDKGRGPAWANSLFEDNAEFAYGMLIGTLQRRESLAGRVAELASSWAAWDEGRLACEAWLNGKDNAEKSRQAADKLLECLAGCKDCGCESDVYAKAVFKDADLLTKRSVWAFGGDGWAYDIGYGGLDHVLAQGEDVNLLVMDTEVYSNTGGQASKATPTGSVAKFAAAGKRTRKKDLGLMAMAYGYVYVASVAMGASQSQLLKAVIEAESYPGPSLIIAYSPCINHGINMGATQLEQKRAVEAGYWPLYRFNPLNENPLTIDSKDPTGSYQDFIRGEVRYQTLLKQFPGVAEELFVEAEKEAAQRLEMYRKIAATMQ